MVTAVLANGLSRDVPPYVSYSQTERTEQDRNFTVAFTHVMYHNQEAGQEMLSGVATAIPNVTIGEGIFGDADNNGSIEQADTQMIQDYEAQLLEKEPVLSAADVRGDGRVDSITRF